MTGFAQVLAAVERHDDGWELEVPESWLQGRTAYGGFSSALALAVAQQAGGELAPLRSAQLAMMAPVNGKIVARAKVERQGRNATWISAHLSSGAGMAFAANFVFMRPTANTLEINDRPLPDSVVPLDDAVPIPADALTVFMRSHFDVRFGMPEADRKRPEMCWWLRSRDHGRLDPMVELMLCGDGLPPAVIPVMPQPVPISSMHWQVNLLTATPQSRDGWWLLRSTGDYAQQGCSSQGMGLWNAGGEPIATGIQSVALFG